MHEQQEFLISVRNLRRDWEGLMESALLSEEATYRISKLIERSLSIEGKMFLKTLKGQDLIVQCAERTRALREELTMPGDTVYKGLTELEECYEELLRKTSEFRVKAG